MIGALKSLLNLEELWTARAMTRQHRYDVIRALLPIVGLSDFEGILNDTRPVKLYKLSSSSEVPKGEANEVVIAELGTILHFQINDSDKKPLLQTDQRHQTSRRHWVHALKAYADKHSLWEKPPLTGDARKMVVLDLLAIIAQSPLDHRLEDLNLPPIPSKVPWSITYTIDVLDHGADDFATTTMFFDSHKATEAFLERIKELGTTKSRL